MFNIYKYFNNSSILDNQQLYEDAIDYVNLDIDIQEGEFNASIWESIKHIIKKIPNAAVTYAINITKGRWVEAEPYILTNRRQIIEYTENVMKERWPAGEAVLLSNYFRPEGQYILYLYARCVIKGRWPEAEPLILTDHEAIYYYARYILDERWPEGEQAMLSLPFNSDEHSFYLRWYATNVMKQRWPEAEQLAGPTAMSAFWKMFS